MSSLLSISLFFFALISTTRISAQEISTVGEIYDYEVNDVFHTREHASADFGGFHEYQNILITDKFYSAEGDTVFYARNVALYWAGSDNPDGSSTFFSDTIFYTDLDELIHNGFIDSVYTSEAYNGRKVNYNHSSPPPYQYFVDRFIEGCGGTYFKVHMQYDDISLHQRLELIYYRKGTEEWGAPYYITAVETPATEFRLKFFPNPSTDKIQVRLPNSNNKPGSGKIYSNTGRCVQVFDFAPQETLNIDISHLGPGVYVLQLIADDASFGGRFMKE